MTNLKILKPEFFDRNSVSVAKSLIGKYLVRELDGNKEYYKIIETESYEGLEDQASHAHRGETPRNKPMFQRAGTIYVYFTYGMHWMLNIVCGKKGHPAAVLIRGVEDCSGPGRLTKKLKINNKINGIMLGKKAGLWVAELKNENQSKKIKIISTPRIGIERSGPVWSKKLYRFVLQSGNGERSNIKHRKIS